MPWQPITRVEQLVARFENSTLDYKRKYDLATKATRCDIASDVAAFANGQYLHGSGHDPAVILDIDHLVERSGTCVSVEGWHDAKRTESTLL